LVKRSILLLAVLLELATFAPAAGDGSAVTFTCVPLEVVVLDASARVLCAEPITVYRGGYPLDNGYPVKSFAVSLSDSNWSGRFIQVGDIAMASGMPILFSYTSGDYKGESFGCNRTDCRVPWAFTLVKTAWTP
jgi:hypothetical protein